MDLRAFVKQVLDDVDKGLREHLEERLPSKDSVKHEARVESAHEARMGDITFDVAVTVAESSTTKGKAGVGIVQVVGLGGEFGSESKQESASRIQFTIRARHYAVSGTIVSY